MNYYATLRKMVVRIIQQYIGESILHNIVKRLEYKSIPIYDYNYIKMHVHMGKMLIKTRKIKDFKKVFSN